MYLWTEGYSQQEEEQDLLDLAVSLHIKQKKTYTRGKK